MASYFVQISTERNHMFTRAATVKIRLLQAEKGQHKSSFAGLRISLELYVAHVRAR